MSDVFGCGHPKTPENTQRIGAALRVRIYCRTCRLTHKRKWRERAREKAEEQRMMRRPILLPPLTLAPAPELLTPEAIGSRRLLVAYARYYEKHVKSEAA